MGQLTVNLSLEGPAWPNKDQIQIHSNSKPSHINLSLKNCSYYHDIVPLASQNVLVLLFHDFSYSICSMLFYFQAETVPLCIV